MSSVGMFVSILLVYMHDFSKTKKNEQCYDDNDNNNINDNSNITIKTITPTGAHTHTNALN